MRLSILIPTIEERKSLLSRLLFGLEQQLTDEVEVIVYDGRIPAGDKYNQMFKIAKGDFIVCVDDDDYLADDYVSKVVPKLNNIDFLGYKILTLNNGRYWMTIEHKLENENVWTKPPYSRRQLSHKCPIKREIAKQFAFDNHYTADREWLDKISQSGLVKKGEYIDSFLYIYDFWESGTVGTSQDQKNFQSNINNQRDVGYYPFNKNSFIWI
jgi:glycosyltransferase involved in cell wall biosynthesis